MSTTMPFGSSCSAMKAARTTKVAPCSCCAGPNTAPRNECAIMIWSDTSTANTGPSLFSAARITNERAACVALRRQQASEPRRQLIEIDGGRQQRVEHRIVEQRQRGGE